MPLAQYMYHVQTVQMRTNLLIIHAVLDDCIIVVRLIVITVFNVSSQEYSFVQLFSAEKF